MRRGSRRGTHSTFGFRFSAKVKLASTPLKNQWWNVPLYLDARGLTTRVLRHREVGFRIDLDLLDQRLVLVTDSVASAGFDLRDGLSVADFHRRLMALLADAGIEARTSEDPQHELLSFLESAYHAGAQAADWPVERFRSNWSPRAGELVVLGGH